MGTRLRIGCPVWACSAWRGRLYTRDAERKDYLPQYARVFSTVEGNSSFYALPTEAAVLRWREETPADFRFCFKFPQDITHRRGLRAAGDLVHAFLKRMDPLGERLGPFLVQLPPRFGPAQLDILRAFLRSLPAAFGYAVEIRHPDFYDQGPHEAALNELLRDRGVDRAHIDTRCLQAATALDDSTRAALARKPVLPLRTTTTAERPFLRFVAQNQAAAASAWLLPWAETIAAWLAAGLEPHVFIHTPDDREAPELARRLHAAVAARLPSLAPLAAFPGESEVLERKGQSGPQLSLF